MFMVEDVDGTRTGAGYHRGGIVRDVLFLPTGIQLPGGLWRMF